MDSNGITYGKQFIMDSNGVRLGSIIMDHNGIRMATHDNDTPGPPQAMAAGSASRHMPGFTQPEPARGRSHAHDHAEGKGKAVARDRSTSSVSSASSVSSSSTASSLDSLPDYDDVREQQLPTYLNILRDWTSNPNHIRTNTDVIWFKNELKLAKFHSANSSVDKKELKSQIKTLLKQWKQIQRDQRKLQHSGRET
ncbi:hypothetical protein NLG97_g11407 [Lecanicillium saksenae]|uniref:Uncharacterized protein n=1 Tax=Lecanicillium saksenae TaxID=468837 RepID=A0ACC1QBV7_9HYPO|nr:hypothetical protein NLG97_g11407 [Lecanicillium saksenae]